MLSGQHWTSPCPSPKAASPLAPMVHAFPILWAFHPHLGPLSQGPRGLLRVGLQLGRTESSCELATVPFSRADSVLRQGDSLMNRALTHPPRLDALHRTQPAQPHWDDPQPPRTDDRTGPACRLSHRLQCPAPAPNYCTGPEGQQTPLGPGSVSGKEQGGDVGSLRDSRGSVITSTWFLSELPGWLALCQPLSSHL